MINDSAAAPPTAARTMHSGDGGARTATPAPSQHIAVIGAGAVGTLVAAELADRGHDVLLCSRRPHHPRTIQIDHGPEALVRTVRTLTAPARAPQVDWVLLATKAYDTASTRPWLDHLVGSNTRLVVLQNGIDQVERVRPLVAPGVPILPAIMYLAVELVAPGHALWSYGQDIAVPDDQTGAQFARLLEGARLTVRRRHDFATAAWTKMLVNVVTNPITALTGRRMEVFGYEDIDVLARYLLDEATAAARAAGVELTDRDVDGARKVICGLSPDTGTSMLYDRLSGRPVEYDLLLGAVARTADAHGVPAPVTHSLLALLHALPEKTAVTSL